MNKISLRFVILVFFGLSNFARAQAPSLSVKNTSSAKKIKTLSRDSNGAYSKEVDRSVTLNISITPFSVPNGGYDIEWFFIAKTVAHATPWIFDAGSKHSDTGAEKFDVSSKSIQSQDSRSKDYSIGTAGSPSTVVVTTTDRASGSKFGGWIVRVKAKGAVVRLESSLSELKEMARQNPQIFDKAAAELSKAP